MAKIYSSGNYVIVDDGDNLYEYAKGHTLYTYKNGVYTIKELTQGQYRVTQEQLNSRQIKQKGGEPFDEVSFADFLREHTGM
jgi:hypothetical protein